jgi:hypothetical protein
MKKLFAFVVLAFAAACNPPAPPAPAEQSQPAGALEVREPWARASAGGASVAAGYMTIANGTAADDRLVSVSSPRAGRVEIHEMAMDGAVMRMRALEGGLAIPAGETVTLAPGGTHLMFIDIAAPFAEGEETPVTLTFESAGAFEMTLPVRAGGAAHDGGH